MKTQNKTRIGENEAWQTREQGTPSKLETSFTNENEASFPGENEASPTGVNEASLTGVNEALLTGVNEAILTGLRIQIFQILKPNNAKIQYEVNLALLVLSFACKYHEIIKQNTL